MSKLIDHSGSTFDSFLEEEHLLQETEAVALKRVIAWQLQRAMQKKRITKTVLARRLHTSRSQLNRLLDPSEAGVSLETITKAAGALGKRVRISIVDGQGQDLKSAPRKPARKVSRRPKAKVVPA